MAVTKLTKLLHKAGLLCADMAWTSPLKVLPAMARFLTSIGTRETTPHFTLHVMRHGPLPYSTQQQGNSWSLLQKLLHT